MRSSNQPIAEDRDNEPNSSLKRLLQVHEGDFALASLDTLRDEWRRLYRCEPPRISRDLLVRGIAYRRQELEHGGDARRLRIWRDELLVLASPFALFTTLRPPTWLRCVEPN